jgi:hypothetical protein
MQFSNGAPGVETNETILEANYHIKLNPGLYVMRISNTSSDRAPPIRTQTHG